MISPMDMHEPIEGILISDEEKRKASILTIEIMEGVDTMVGKQLTINAQGLVMSKRKKKDGNTIIGS